MGGALPACEPSRRSHRLSGLVTGTNGIDPKPTSWLTALAATGALSSAASVPPERRRVLPTPATIASLPRSESVRLGVAAAPLLPPTGNCRGKAKERERN